MKQSKQQEDKSGGNMSDKFKVVFTGELQEGFSLEEAKASIQQSFALTDAQIEKIFTGRPIVLKKNIDYGAAERFKSLLDKAGVISNIVEIHKAINKEAVQVQKSMDDTGQHPVTPGNKDIKLELESGEHDLPETDKSFQQQVVRPPVEKTTCAECGRRFGRSEMMPYKDSYICAECKPAFTQKLKEGVPLATEMIYAGFWIRFGAKIIDGIILGIVNTIITMLASPFAAIDAPETPEDVQAFMAVNIIVWLLQMASGISYVTFFLGKFAATPGKMACKIKVVTGEGEKITYLRAFGRYFAEIISAIILSIGYLMAAFDDEKRTLHDRICNTRVIQK